MGAGFGKEQEKLKKKFERSSSPEIDPLPKIKGCSCTLHANIEKRMDLNFSPKILKFCLGRINQI